MILHRLLYWCLPILEGVLVGFAAMLLHEAGHVMASLVLGVQVKKIRLGWQGLHMIREVGPPLTNLLVSISGPLINIVSMVAFREHRTFALANLCFAACNLLPISDSDGERALRCWHLLRGVAKESGAFAKVYTNDVNG